jgi:hypothetical protein
MPHYHVPAGLLAMAVSLLVGCGGSTPEDQVRDAARQIAEDGRANRWGDFCAATTDPDQCQVSAAALKAAGVNAAEFIPSSDLLENATIKVNGDRATVDATAGEDAEYVRNGDRWLFVWRTN